jgi:hypothetical protein
MRRYFSRRLDSFRKAHHHSRIAMEYTAARGRELGMQRRNFLKFSLGTAALAALSSRASAQSAVKEIRIGYQKNGVLVITRQQAALEKHFATQGIEVKWVEFSSGPPMMEAMNVGSVDYGAVDDSPPVLPRPQARRSFMRQASRLPTVRASWSRRILDR